MTIALIPVRKLNDDGYVYIQFLKPDGTKPGSDRSQYLAPDMDSLNVTHPITITALWDTQYQLGDEGAVIKSETFSNLKYLSDNDPLLFEEILVRLETCDRSEGTVWKQRLMDQVMRPKTTKNTKEDYIALYRQMLRVVPLATLLEFNTADRDNLISRGRRSTDYLHYEYLDAAVLCCWIMSIDDSIFKPNLNYSKCEDEFKFIHENFDAVMNIRKELRRIRTIERTVIAEMLNGSPALTDGYI